MLELRSSLWPWELVIADTIYVVFGVIMLLGILESVLTNSRTTLQAELDNINHLFKIVEVKQYFNPRLHIL
jgi:hypothetical protein